MSHLPPQLPLNSAVSEVIEFSFLLTAFLAKLHINTPSVESFQATTAHLKVQLILPTPHFITLET